jgi:hypothetical protein
MLYEVIDKEELKHCLKIDTKNKLSILRKKNPELIFDYSYTI